MGGAVPPRLGPVAAPQREPAASYLQVRCLGYHEVAMCHGEVDIAHLTDNPRHAFAGTATSRGSSITAAMASSRCGRVWPGGSSRFGPHSTCPPCEQLSGGLCQSLDLRSGDLPMLASLRAA